MLQAVTLEEVVRDIEDHRAEWEPEEKLPRVLVQVYLQGRWLSWKLKDAGADADSREAACFALGQRLLGRTLDKYPKITADAWNRWIEGEEDVPGRALSEELFQGKHGKKGEFGRERAMEQTFHANYGKGGESDG